jgi:hypothetical protein
MPINSTVRGSFGPQGKFGRGPLGTVSNPALSGVALYNSGIRTDGTFWLNPTGTNAFQAYVINSRDGGGWVKVLQYYDNTTMSSSSAINQNGTWTTKERNLAAGKLATADITALHQNKTTFLGRTYSESGNGAHRYWRFRVGSTISGHFPRVARIGLTTNEGVSGTDYDVVVYTADNCADSGTIPGDGTSFSYDFGSPKTVIGSYISSSFGGGARASTCFVDWSDNGSSWTQLWSGPVSNINNQCGVIRFGANASDGLWGFGAGTAKYVGTQNIPAWGTDLDPTGYTWSLDSSSNGQYLYAKTYGNDTQGRCGHENNGWYWPSDHNYTNNAICWSFNANTFASNLHWMYGSGSTDSSTGGGYAGGEVRFGKDSFTSMAIYVK